MKNTNRCRLAIVALTIAFLSGPDVAFGQSDDTVAPAYPDPARFEKSIQAFEAQDKKDSPPQGAIVCTGSSSIRLWHKKIAEDLSPLTVIPRGFGGSTMHDLLHFTDRVILKYRPRAVVIYEGDNDTSHNIPADQIMEEFQLLCNKIHKSDAKIRIYFLAIKPSQKRVKIWPKAVQANQQISELCDNDKRLFYIDVASPLLDDQGMPKSELFLKDELHLNRRGYEKWTQIVRPILLKHEQAFEVPARQ